MTHPPQRQDDEEQQEADRQAASMKAQLRKDVDSWSRSRSETSMVRSAEPSSPIAAKPEPSSAMHRTKKSKPPRAIATPSIGPKKPFSMSYDGVTSDEYIQYMIDRGSR